MAKIIIPTELLNKDLWSQFGKITLNESMTLKNAKIAKEFYPSIQILEEEKPKVSKKKKTE